MLEALKDEASEGSLAAPPCNKGGGGNEMRLVHEFGAAEVKGELPDPLVLHHEAVAVRESVERPGRVLLPHVHDYHLRTKERCEILQFGTL